MKSSTMTFVIGAAQALYGLVGLVFGWIDTTTALGLITSGVAIFGITRQTTTLGNSLGKAV